MNKNQSVVPWLKVLQPILPLHNNALIRYWDFLERNHNAYNLFDQNPNLSSTYLMRPNQYL